jgi:putative CocE/NonD family hydrolase
MSSGRFYWLLGLVYAGVLGCQAVDSSRCPPEPLAPQRTTSLSPTTNTSSKSSDVNERAAFIRSHYTKFEARIPMRDGIKLFTALYVPIDASRSRTYPFLITRTPYSVNPYGADEYRERLASEPLEREGFIFVWQDVRGRNASEGEYVNMRPHKDNKGAKDFDESTDAYDTIEWLTKHIPEGNGKAGLVGTSYPGFYASAGAIDSHPALKATSPQAPIADWFIGDDMHRNGAFSLQLSFGFFAGFDEPRPKPAFDRKWKSFDMGTPDAYEFFLHAGPLADAEKQHFKGDRPYWHEIVTHPNYDEAWKSKNLLPHLRNINAASLIVGGWFDAEDLYGPLQTYKTIEKNNPKSKNSLIMGPWRHGGWHKTKGEKLGDADFGFETSRVFQDIELGFFKHHLKDGPDPNLAEAIVFETGANRFRRFDAWPPKSVKSAKLFLRADGKLAFEPPSDAATAADEFVSDPAKPVPYTQNMQSRYTAEYMTEDQRFAARRPDVLVYQSPILEQDMTLAGPLTADLWVSTTGTDADWIVKLVDEHPGKTGDDDSDEKDSRGGEQLLVRGEPIRGRFRDGFETPKAFVPGENTRVKFVLNDVLHTFKRGHRIVIHVQSSWFPNIDRNPQTFVPNIFEAKPNDYVKATHRVLRSKDMPSGIDVWVLPSVDE